MDKNPKNSFYFIHPKDEEQKVFLYEESNHRWSTLRNYAKGNIKQPDANFLLCIGINGGEWDKGIYSGSIYHHEEARQVRSSRKHFPGWETKPASFLVPHLIYDINADRVYRLKCRLRHFNEVIEGGA